MKNQWNTKLIGLGVLTFFIFFLSSCGPSIEITPEMEAFLIAIDSTNSMDDSAEPYGYTAEEIPLGYFEVKEPSVTAFSVVGSITCYEVNVKHGFIDNNIQVCWEGEKIIGIIDLD